MNAFLTRLARKLTNEDGISLVMAIGILGVLSIAGAAAVFYAGSNSRSADYSNADNAAFSLSEAGVAEGLSVIGDASDPTDSALLSSPSTVSLESGDVTYSGTKSTAGDGSTIWTITSTSTVDNPTGPSASDIQRTLTQKVKVTALVPGADPADWDRLFHNRTDKCLTIDTVEIPTSVTSRGDICLNNLGSIKKSTTGNPVTVRTGDDIFINHAQSKIGDNQAIDRVQLVAVAGKCKFKTSPATTPCGENDGVFTEEFSPSPSSLFKPQVDHQYWYDNAKPGPNHNCTTGSFPGGFDNDGVMNGSRSGSGEITPKNSSYSCKVVEDGETVGEISWNHNSNILTIHGTIFIDGDMRFDDDGDLVNYQGRATIYAGDDLEFDELVCAGGDGSRNCRNDMDNWDPEQNMMILISQGWSEYDQGGNLAPAAFQGVVYAEEFCLIHQDIYVSGPMICDEIRIQEDDEDQGGGWPTFFSWPELQSLIPGVLVGDPSNAADWKIELLEQTG
ncbi:MAG: hypothetical protein OEM67_01325 [Thermoleophilia bacterium]|nr:hypothetical protein [Thermoleophilia bacterium]MDH3725100.1 hypothetical protein [Thermoleophilia bacterium]